MRPPRLLALALGLSLSTALAPVLARPSAAEPPDGFSTPLGAATERWRVEIDGQAPFFDTVAETLDEARDVAILPNGNVVAAGRVRNDEDLDPDDRAHYDIIAALFDVETGSELARFEVDGGDFRNDEAFAVAVDAQGNTIVAGRARRDLNGSFNHDFAVVKLDGSLDPVWPSTFFFKDGSASDAMGQTETALDVAIDSNGDIFAVGQLRQTTTGADFAVCKIDGSTGAELWCATEDGTQPTALERQAGGSDPLPNDPTFLNPDPDRQQQARDRALRVAVDANDDVVVAGTLEEAGAMDAIDLDAYVAKYDGDGDGMGGPLRLWERLIAGTQADDLDEGGFALALDASGDVYVTGGAVNTMTDADLFVARLGANDGVPVWLRTIDQAGAPSEIAPEEFEYGTALALLDGDLILAGVLDSDEASLDMFVARLDPTNGNSIWEGVLEGNATRSFDAATSVTVLTNGDIAIGGQFQNDFDNMSPTGPGTNNEFFLPDPSNLDFSVVVLDPAGDGQGGLLEKWRMDLLGFDNRFPQDQPPFHSLDLVHVVVPGPDGDVIAAGQITRPNESISGEHTTFAVSRIPEPGATLAGAAAALALGGLRRRRAGRGD